MTNNNHPITPPPDLVEQWEREYRYMTFCSVGPDMSMFLTEKAARWGADQELEACCEWLCEWLETGPYGFAIGASAPGAAWRLRGARRPTSSSLKEQAQRILVENGTTTDGRIELDPDDIGIIRRAIASLPD